MKRSSLSPLLLLAALAAFVSVTPACDKQGEGELCNTLNGNDDCADGLTCTPGAQVGQKKDVCCPLSGSTDPRCILGGITSNGGSGGGGASGGTGGTTTSSSSTSDTGGTGGTTGGTGGTTGGTGGTTGGTGGM